MSTPDVVLVGCGNLGSALALGWLYPQAAVNSLTIVVPSGLVDLPKIANHSLVTVTTQPENISPDAIIVLAVKPGTMRDAIESLWPSLHPTQRVVSVAAGVRMDSLADMDATKRWSRAMPSIAAATREAFTTLFETDDDTAALFKILGNTLAVDKEDAMDIATVIGACGPGVMAWMAQTWLESAKDYGIREADMQRMMAAMFTASGALLADSPDFGSLVSKVATKGGMTEAMIDTLMKEQAPRQYKAAIQAAMGRAIAMNAAF